MIEGSCHCGAIRFRLARPPEKLTDCNCSACRRYRGLWAHFAHEDVVIELGGPVIRYTHGERGLAFVSCATCGGTTHWEPNGEEHNRGYLAVNAAMLEPGVLDGIPVRHFDGADTWQYLD